MGDTFASPFKLNLFLPQIIGMLLCVLMFVILCYEAYHQSAPFRIVSPVVILVGLLIAQLVLHIEHGRGVRSSTVLTIFWSLTVLSDIVKIRSFSLQYKVRE